MASHKEEQINTAKKKMCTCQKQVSCLFTTAADKDFEPGITHNYSLGHPTSPQTSTRDLGILGLLLKSHPTTLLIILLSGLFIFILVP